MRIVRFLVAILSAFSFSVVSMPQQSIPDPTQVRRDLQAIDVLTRVVNAAGGLAALNSIHDFSSSGSITYNWGNQDVQGSVMIRSRGADQFRLDANLPEGVRTWFVNNRTGAIRESSGYMHEIPFHNAMNLGCLTFPYPVLVGVSSDSSATIQYLGLVTKDGRNTYQIRVQPIPVDAEPSGMLHKLSTKEFFIDTTTFQIVSTLDMVHPDDDFDQDYPREIRFSDYRIVNRVLVPFESEERVNGQHTWTIRLNDITFNRGFPDDVFRF